MAASEVTSRFDHPRMDTDPRNAKTGTDYLTVDHLGSTRLVTDQTGAMVSRHDFLAFGDEINAGVGGRTVAMGYAQNPYAAMDPTQRFTGKERDTVGGAG